jgi:predicted PurR-regulated permease PerM
VEDDRNRVLESPFVARAARWGVVAWAAIGVLLVGYFVLRFVVYPVRIIFPPLIVATIAVYLLNPVVSGLQRRGIGRVWGALMVYLVAGSVVGTALYFLVPVVAEQVTAFAGALPRILGRAAESFRDIAARFGLDVGETGPVESGSVVEFLGRVLSITRGLFDLALVFILGPILGFYFLVDLPKVKRGVRALIPARRRAELESILEKIGRAVGGFVRGQLMVAAFVGVASSLALFIVGLPFWALVGLVSGLFNLIPLIGPFIGTAIAVFIAFTTQESAQGLLGLAPGWPLALGSAIALVIVQQIDNHILSPNVVGRTVRLHPVTIMLGLLVGGALLGLWGMLLAIPVIASLKVLFLHAWDTRVTWPPPTAEEEGEPSTEPAVEPSRAPAWMGAMRSLFGRRGPVPRPESSRAPQSAEPPPEREVQAEASEGSEPAATADPARRAPS